MLNVEQLKYSVNRMPIDRVADAVLELRLEGLVTDDRTPFGKVHFNTCFAAADALCQRAGYQLGGKSLYLPFPHRAVRGSLFPDPATGCRCRRLPG